MSSAYDIVGELRKSVNNTINDVYDRGLKARVVFEFNRPLKQVEVIGKTAAVAYAAGFIGSLLFGPITTTAITIGAGAKAFEYFAHNPKKYSVIASGSENRNSVDNAIEPSLKFVKRLFDGAAATLYRAGKAAGAGLQHAWSDFTKSAKI